MRKADVILSRRRALLCVSRQGRAEPPSWSADTCSLSRTADASRRPFRLQGKYVEDDVSKYPGASLAFNKVAASSFERVVGGLVPIFVHFFVSPPDPFVRSAAAGKNENLTAGGWAGGEKCLQAFRAKLGDAKPPPDGVRRCAI